MKVGVLGSGDVARVLAGGFLKHGHSVMMGTRDPAKLEGWAAKNPAARVGSFADAAAFADLVVLAVKGTAASDALRLATPANLAGKPMIDATNPISDLPPVNVVLQFFTGLDDSLLERLQREFPLARFVKAFNSVGSARMVNPEFTGGKPTMFICGNDDRAREIVVHVLEQLVGRRRTWGRRRPPAPSNRSACFGASVAFRTMNGLTPLSC